MTINNESGMPFICGIFLLNLKLLRFLPSLEGLILKMYVSMSHCVNVFVRKVISKRRALHKTCTKSQNNQLISSVLDWCKLAMEAHTGEFPQFQASCKLVSVHYREYKHGLFIPEL